MCAGMTEMGPIESTLRFGIISTVMIGIVVLFGWWIMSIGGPIWPVGILVVIFGGMILVAYERLMS